MNLNSINFSNSLLLKIFLLLNSLSRIILFFFAVSENQIIFSLLDFAQVISFGLLSDFVTASFIMLIVRLISFLIPETLAKKPILNYIFYFIVVFLFTFLVAAEFIFWLEFSTRFNFIAVDYLVYTHEVIGNIRQSYPLFIIFPGLLLFSIIFFYKLFPAIKPQHLSLGSKTKSLIFYSCLSLLTFYQYDNKYSIFRDNNFLSELSNNGIYNLFSAFRNNSINYPEFYQVRDNQKMLAELTNFITEQGQKEIDPTKLKREVITQGKEKNYNVILITVESLSAEYLNTNYISRPLTPFLNNLIPQSIYFSNFYATGTRTVRGLEAITLSIPPIPGQSILRRQNNEKLFSIASVLNQQGYMSKFIYGGYGTFDNMNYFFSKNGFQVIDRNKITEKEIKFSNIWGISDEDLYTETLKQADQSYAQNQKFFSLVMTTSNHRPYTYPEGKIDVPSGTNRQGGVKYTDYALSEFFKIAQTKPWFENTIFIITADHCAGSAGKMALPVEKYHIPLIIYAPHILKAKKITQLSSQIDIAPTILGLLNVSYQSQFFGNDLFNKTHHNAFISTFQKLGYIDDKKLVVLSPGKLVQTYKILDNNQLVESEIDKSFVDIAIDYYQAAFYMFSKGLLKQDENEKLGN